MKKILRYIATALMASLILFNAWVLLTGKSYFYKALVYNFADIDDYKIFDNRTIKKSSSPLAWSISKTYNRKDIAPDLRKELDSLQTVALLIIKDDSLIYEEYWRGHTDTSISNSFSMAKSYVSALIGVALQEGVIKDINQPVCDFLPDFCGDGKEKITIRHLLLMSGGLSWEEGYASPFSPTTEAYYGTDLKKMMSTLTPIEEPGKIFRYKSSDTQLLAFILEKATGKKLADYAAEKLWQPLGCSTNALWSLDKKDGNEKGYCCVNATARDFAKLGKLYLDSGRFQGKQLIPQEYVLTSVTPNGLPDGDLAMAPTDFYGYQWWTIPQYKGLRIFYARGILGQYVIVIPEKKMIVVRLGNYRGPSVGKHYHETFSLIDEALRR
jgi:CubicO group peptidase (beta-lactamase class C family)